jgi:hypothetical protein
MKAILASFPGPSPGCHGQRLGGKAQKAILIFLLVSTLLSTNLFAGGSKESGSSSGHVDAVAAAAPLAYRATPNQPVLVATKTGQNSSGAATGTISAYPPSAVQTGCNCFFFVPSFSSPGIQVPFVSGGNNGAAPCPNGTAFNVKTNVPCKQSPTAAQILTSPNYGGMNSTFMPSINSGGIAIHQANNQATIVCAQTAGCIGVTTANRQTSTAQQNYNSLSNYTNGFAHLATVIVRR